MGWEPSSAARRHHSVHLPSGERASFQQFLDNDYKSSVLNLHWDTDVYKFDDADFHSLEIDRNMAIPCWMAAAFLAGLPVWWTIRWRQRRQEASLGLCAQCSYDLRAMPDRCPECGTVPTKL
jgi:hypothetical protein